MGKGYEKGEGSCNLMAVYNSAVWERGGGRRRRVVETGCQMHRSEVPGLRICHCRNDGVGYSSASGEHYHPFSRLSYCICSVD